MPLLSPSASFSTTTSVDNLSSSSSVSDDIFLLCGEDAGLLSAADEASFSSARRFVLLEDAEEEEEMVVMAALVGREGHFTPRSGYASRFRSLSLDPVARWLSVDWILKVCAFYRFGPLTAYLAVSYMDRFLSSHSLPQPSGWPMQLLTVACLSLAAKMEEALVPSPLDLQIEAEEAATARWFIFEPKTICRMELLVLTALNWRLHSVTPFTYMSFFTRRAADDATDKIGCLTSLASQIILDTMRDADFMEYLPSEMAAAAVVCASCETPGMRFIDPDTAMSWCPALTKVGIVNCYRLMLELDMKRKKIPTQLGIIGKASAAAGSCSSSSPSSLVRPSKRRKLNHSCRLWEDDDNNKDIAPS